MILLLQYFQIKFSGKEEKMIIIEIIAVGVMASIAIFLWSLLFATTLVFPAKMAEFLLDEEVPLWKKIIAGFTFVLVIGALVTIAAMAM